MFFHECLLFVLIHFSHLKRNCLEKVKYFKIYIFGIVLIVAYVQFNLPV